MLRTPLLVVLLLSQTAALGMFDTPGVLVLDDVTFQQVLACSASVQCEREQGGRRFSWESALDQLSSGSASGVAPRHERAS
jgi:hypothetical protein